MRPNLCEIVTDENFEKEVLQAAGVVLVEIAAEWCGTCHIMAPVLEKLADEYKGRVKFVGMDIETSEQVAREYGVNELPLLLFFKDGQLVDHAIGGVSKQILKERIEALTTNNYQQDY